MPRNLRLSVLGLVLCLRNASFTCQGFPDQEGRECEGEAFSRLAAVFQNEAPYEQPNSHEYKGCWNWDSWDMLGWDFAALRRTRTYCPVVGGPWACIPGILDDDLPTRIIRGDSHGYSMDYEVTKHSGHFTARSNLRCWCRVTSPWCWPSPTDGSS